MSTAPKVGYARVSTEDQNLERQLEALKAAGVPSNRIFTDKISGKNTQRPGFEEMMRYLRRGDELYVTSMDRLSRSLQDLLAVTTTLRDRGVVLHFLKERIDLSPDDAVSPVSTFMFSMLGAVAQFERELIRERQREGIAIAQAKGVYKGRKPIPEETIAEAKRRIEQGIPLAKVARDLNVNRTTIYKRMKSEEG